MASGGGILLLRAFGLAFQLPIDYFEREVASIEVERKSISAAAAGMLTGVKTQLHKPEVRKGVRVFRIRR